MLYCDDVPDGRGGTYRRQREYRVSMVDWTISAGESSAFVLVRLEFLRDISGAQHGP